MERLTGCADFFTSLFKNNFSLVNSPGGATQWEALNATASHPDPFVSGRFRKPTMLTSDLALLHDTSYYNISETFLNTPAYFAETFSRTWCMFFFCCILFSASY